MTCRVVLFCSILVLGCSDRGSNSMPWLFDVGDTSTDAQLTTLNSNPECTIGSETVACDLVACYSVSLTHDQTEVVLTNVCDDVIFLPRFSNVNGSVRTWSAVTNEDQIPIAFPPLRNDGFLCVVPGPCDRHVELRPHESLTIPLPLEFNFRDGDQAHLCYEEVVGGEYLVPIQTGTMIDLTLSLPLPWPSVDQVLDEDCFSTFCSRQSLVWSDSGISDCRVTPNQVYYEGLLTVSISDGG